MKVLVACEFSGTVRDAFLRRGHDAWSCDLLPTESPGPHIQGDCLDLIGPGNDWDLLVAHPPCTHLAVSGAKHFVNKIEPQEQALDFVLALLNAPVPQVAVENPVSVISSRICKPTQIVQPHWFGNPETKTTCLWLRGLPPLKPTSHVRTTGNRLFRLPPSQDRWKERSKTYLGIAEAMAEQWGVAQNYCWRSRTGYRESYGFVKKPRV